MDRIESMSELKVQFAAGWNHIPGWHNHDQESADITKRLPYEDGTVDFILVEHGAEHCTCAEVQFFFEDCRRILKNGGALRVCVPSPFRVKDDAHARDLVVSHGHKMIFTPEILDFMLRIAGFGKRVFTGRADCDSHWRAIGHAKDDLETIRVEGIKC